MAQEAHGRASWRLAVQAGPRTRTQAPLSIDGPEGAADGTYRLVRDGVSVPAQVWQGRFLAVLPHLAAGEEREYALEAAPPEAAVAIARKEAAVGVRVHGEPFTTLHLTGAPKPFLHPLLSPGGVCVVRGWPVGPGSGDSTDHPHHRGAWVGHGDVNGMDAWEERPDRLGRIAVDAAECASGPVCGHVRLALRWLLPDGRAVAAERRLYRFWAVDGQARLFDQESVYSGIDGGAVRFGDTKEGALCAIRVATGMEGKAGGRITTAEGAIGEREAWGSAAGWCDYSGEPAGAGGRTVGAAIFDHPDNPLHPTRWHVRDYGLMTANPFALSHYFPRSGRRGDWEIPAGGSATFRFRVCVHTDGAEAAAIARRYADWAFAPRARWSRAGA